MFVTILGYVLHGDPSAMRSVESAVQKNFPGINGILKISALHGSAVALVLGVLTSLWSGLGVTGAAQNALDTVWAVPFKARPNYISSRLRGIGLLGLIGVLFIIATGASGVVSAGLGGPLAKIGGIVVSLLFNVILFFAAFRLMTAKSVQTHSLWVGVVAAAVFWTILQAVGGIYIHHVVSHLSTAYASFAIVIPLLIWLHLGAQLTLYAAEINVVVSRKLWPRSLMGPPRQPADQETLEALAKVEERHADEKVDVSFVTEDAHGEGRGDGATEGLDEGVDEGVDKGLGEGAKTGGPPAGA